MNTQSNGKGAGAKPRTAKSSLRRASTGEAADIPTEDNHMSEEIKRPKNQGVGTLPRDGFVLTVDGKMKTRFETETEATAEASKLKQRFPVIQVAVYDAAARVYTPVNAPAE